MRDIPEPEVPGPAIRDEATSARLPGSVSALHLGGICSRGEGLDRGPKETQGPGRAAPRGEGGLSLSGEPRGVTPSQEQGWDLGMGTCAGRQGRTFQSVEGGEMAVVGRC